MLETLLGCLPGARSLEKWQRRCDFSAFHLGLRKRVLWSWLIWSSVLQGQSGDKFLNQEELRLGPRIPWSLLGLACLYAPAGPTEDTSLSLGLFCPVPHAGPSVHCRPGEEQGVVLAVGTGGAVDGTRPYHLTAAWPLVGRALQGGAEL